MNIQVNIDRLVFDGIELPPAQRPELQAALETELSRLLSEGGLSPALLQGANLPVLHLGDLPPAPGPADLGRHIAQAVYGGIGK